MGAKVLAVNNRRKETSMKYFVRSYDPNWREVSKERAEEDVLCVYKDNDMTRDMMSIPNHILLGSMEMIIAESEQDIQRLEDATWNVLPDDAFYDDNGNRVKGDQK